jgi:hypothetical protein
VSLVSKQKLSWVKRIGSLLIAMGCIILAIGTILTISIIIDEVKNPRQGQTGLEVALVFGLALVVSSFPIITGYLLLEKNEEEKIEEHPNNPLICQYCKRDYDRTWKVCLKCGKVLVEK